MDIYIGEFLRNQSYSSVRVFDDEDVYVTRGATNKPGETKVRLLTMEIKKLNITLIGGPQQFEEWESVDELSTSTNNTKIKRDFVFAKLMSVMTYDILMSLLKREHGIGVAHGRNEIRHELKKLLTKEG
jgi:hypothetical protein